MKRNAKLREMNVEVAATDGRQIRNPGIRPPPPHTVDITLRNASLGVGMHATKVTESTALWSYAPETKNTNTRGRQMQLGLWLG